MEKHILIDRGDGSATLVRCSVDSAMDNALTENEILINELYNKLLEKEKECAELIARKCCLE